MQLDPDRIKTKEVLQWKGVHLLNFSLSSCSQKVRILLAEKGVDYRSREIDLKSGANTTEWYLGINSRGVVPVLVHDGDVHIESNDILRYIDEKLGNANHNWVPDNSSSRKIVDKLLQLEDDLHDSLRAITMGFLLPHAVAKKSDAELQAYAQNGPEDPYRTKQIEWWELFAKQGVSAQEAKDAVAAFYKAFAELDEIVLDQDWLLGDRPTVLDIAWFITIHRVTQAGYPLSVHPNLERLFKRMQARSSFRRELGRGPLIVHVAGLIYRTLRRIQNTSLKSVFRSIESELGTNAQRVSA